MKMMKEKLTELLINSPSLDALNEEGYVMGADHLIANGVVIPVRCKDCKHLIVVNQEDIYAYCPKMMTCFLPFQLDTREHFCSCGEKKEVRKSPTQADEIDFDYKAEDE